MKGGYMKKDTTLRCAYCKEIIIPRRGSYRCKDCGKEFCTRDCVDKHDCDASIGDFVPWEQDNEFIEEDGDELVNYLMDIIESSTKDEGEKPNEKACIVCKQEKELVNDLYPYCLCMDCFMNLREKFLAIAEYDKQKGNPLPKGFRFIKLPDGIAMDKEELVALLLTKKLVAKRKIIQVQFSTPSKQGRTIFELYDLKFYEVPAPTILVIENTVYDLDIGCYLIVKDE
jgi:hypothetical protein